MFASIAPHALCESSGDFFLFMKRSLLNDTKPFSRAADPNLGVAVNEKWAFCGVDDLKPYCRWIILGLFGGK
jgi:hypothetical protein